MTLNGKIPKSGTVSNFEILKEEYDKEDRILRLITLTKFKKVLMLQPRMLIEFVTMREVS